jgi:hypothetical protein
MHPHVVDDLREHPRERALESVLHLPVIRSKMDDRAWCEPWHLCFDALVCLIEASDSEGVVDDLPPQDRQHAPGDNVPPWMLEQPTQRRDHQAPSDQIDAPDQPRSLPDDIRGDEPDQEEYAPKDQHKAAPRGQLASPPRPQRERRQRARNQDERDPSHGPSDPRHRKPAPEPEPDEAVQRIVEGEPVDASTSRGRPRQVAEHEHRGGQAGHRQRHTMAQGGSRPVHSAHRHHDEEDDRRHEVGVVGEDTQEQYGGARGHQPR